MSNGPSRCAGGVCEYPRRCGAPGGAVGGLSTPLAFVLPQGPSPDRADHNRWSSRRSAGAPWRCRQYVTERLCGFHRHGLDRKGCQGRAQGCQRQVSGTTWRLHLSLFLHDAGRKDQSRTRQRNLRSLVARSRDSGQVASRLFRSRPSTLALVTEDWDQCRCKFRVGRNVGIGVEIPLLGFTREEISHLGLYKLHTDRLPKSLWFAVSDLSTPSPPPLLPS